MPAGANTVETLRAEPWRSTHAPPCLDLAPLTGAELDAWFRGGEPEADACEALLAWAARARGALDVAIAEGFHALRQGDRLARLGATSTTTPARCSTSAIARGRAWRGSGAS